VRWAFGTKGAGKGGDAYGHHVWKMIRKSDGRAKHTSAMLGIPLSGRDDHESLPTKEKGNARIAKFCKTALCFLSVGELVTAHAQEPLKVDTQGVTAKILYEAPIDGGTYRNSKASTKCGSPKSLSRREGMWATTITWGRAYAR
jgi:hypothetical protein